MGTRLKLGGVALTSQKRKELATTWYSVRLSSVPRHSFLVHFTSTVKR